MSYSTTNSNTISNSFMFNFKDEVRAININLNIIEYAISRSL